MPLRFLRIILSAVAVFITFGLLALDHGNAQQTPKIVPIDWIIGKSLFALEFPHGWESKILCRIKILADGKVRWEGEKTLAPASKAERTVVVPWDPSLNTLYGLLTLNTEICAEDGRTLLEKTSVTALKYVRPIDFPADRTRGSVAGRFSIQAQKANVMLIDLAVNTEKTAGGWKSVMSGEVPFLLRSMMKKDRVSVQSEMREVGSTALAPTQWSTKWREGTIAVKYDQESGIVKRNRPLLQLVPKTAYDYLSMMHCLRRLPLEKESPPIVFVLDKYSAREATFEENAWYSDVNNKKHPVVVLVFQYAEPLKAPSGAYRLRVWRLVNSKTVKEFPSYKFDFDVQGNPILFEMGTYRMVFSGN